MTVLSILSALLSVFASWFGLALGSKLAYKLFGTCSILEDILKWVKK